ncbi:MAG: GNAT family N-acetyltransferase [Pseudonocardiales bacterium]|nr:MAG: GNAT family N-acetyltransferase [Pseudonocardiales bacterium]
MSNKEGAPTIEAGTVDDLPSIVAIYNHSLATSHAIFDTQPTTIDGRRGWLAGFAASGPHRLLVARGATGVLGYASSGRYREHEAFRETVEFSISLDSPARGQGIGTLLYSALFDVLAHEPVHVVLAGIALPNDASVALHRRFGFTDVGVFQEYATKNGTYLSSVWMQRLL